MSDAWAVLPVKDMVDAKQRLSAVLDACERRALFRAMLEDVLDALADARRLAGLLVVSRDEEAVTLARARGAEILGEADNLGQTSAVTAGVQHLAREGVATSISIPADVPLVTGADVDAVLERHGGAPAVTIAPAHDHLGSNAVVCSPPDAMPFRFGDNSFHPHLERARALGIEPRVVERAGLALDVDHPRDLQALLAVDRETRAHAYLRGVPGLRSRLAG